MVQTKRNNRKHGNNGTRKLIRGGGAIDSLKIIKNIHEAIIDSKYKSKTKTIPLKLTNKLNEIYTLLLRYDDKKIPTLSTTYTSDKMTGVVTRISKDIAMYYGILDYINQKYLEPGVTGLEAKFKNYIKDFNINLNRSQTYTPERIESDNPNELVNTYEITDEIKKLLATDASVASSKLASTSTTANQQQENNGIEMKPVSTSTIKPKSLSPAANPFEQFKLYISNINSNISSPTEKKRIKPSIIDYIEKVEPSDNKATEWDEIYKLIISTTDDDLVKKLDTRVLNILISTSDDSFVSIAEKMVSLPKTSLYIKIKKCKNLAEMRELALIEVIKAPKHIIDVKPINQLFISKQTQFFNDLNKNLSDSKDYITFFSTLCNYFNCLKNDDCKVIYLQLITQPQSKGLFNEIKQTIFANLNLDTVDEIHRQYISSGCRDLWKNFKFEGIEYLYNNLFSKILDLYKFKHTLLEKLSVDSNLKEAYDFAIESNKSRRYIDSYNYMAVLLRKMSVAYKIDEMDYNKLYSLLVSLEKMPNLIYLPTGNGSTLLLTSIIDKLIDKIMNMSDGEKTEKTIPSSYNKIMDTQMVSEMNDQASIPKLYLFIKSKEPDVFPESLKLITANENAGVTDAALSVLNLWNETGKAQKEEEEKARKAAEEAARLKAEQEERVRKAAEEAARLKAEDEERVRKAAEEAARLKAEEEERVRKSAEEAARLKAEEEERVRKSAEEAARLKAEEEERVRKSAEEAARLKAEELRKAAEEAARLKAEQEERDRKAEQEERARKASEEAARLKAEQEERARKAAEEAARLKAEQEEAARVETLIQKTREYFDIKDFENTSLSYNIIKSQIKVGDLSDVKEWIEKSEKAINDAETEMTNGNYIDDFNHLDLALKAYDTAKEIPVLISKRLDAVKKWIDDRVTFFEQQHYAWDNKYKDVFPTLAESSITLNTKIVIKNVSKYELKTGAELFSLSKGSSPNANAVPPAPGSVAPLIPPIPPIQIIMPAGIFYEDDKYETQLERYKTIYDNLTKLYLNDSITDLELRSLIKFLEKDDTIKKSKNRDEPLKFIEEIMNRTNNAQPNADVAVTSSSNSLETTGASQVTSDIGWFNRTMNNVVKWLIPPPNKNLVKSN
jgi:hypothetical protein